MNQRTGLILMSVACLLLACLTAPVTAESLDELPLDRWEKLREVERYQLNIAEKYYRERNFKVAAAEYEKFLTLYEGSEGAPYGQLKWSLCKIELRQHNTAIKKGYQSVIDYWPDSPEAIAAAYYIGVLTKRLVKSARRRKRINWFWTITRSIWPQFTPRSIDRSHNH
ncbi:MAG: hypothetical protein WKF77_25560 [Planctomycetaceae bacterium]